MQQLVSRKMALKLTIVAVLVVLGGALLAVLERDAAHASAKPIDVYVNDNQVAFAIDPDVRAGTTVVQMRPLFEALGMEVTWSEEERAITAVKEGARLRLVLDSREAEVNGRTVALDRPAVSENGHTLVPLRFVGESTGSLVHWNGVHREIIVYTPEYVASFGIEMEELKALIDELQKELDAEHAGEAGKDGSQDDGNPEVTLPPVVAEDGAPVSLDQLQGMYYGGQYDYGGYECGGVCWRFYTFLPDQKVVVGQPKGGGPETIDCANDACRTYSVKDGMLMIEGEEPLPVSINEDGALEIDEVAMKKVTPVPDGTKLEGEYISQGYTGLVGITPYASSWTNYMTFYPDGTFTTDQTSLASLDTGNARTDAASTGDTVKGTYSIKGNTIALTYEDGTVERHVFAISPRQSDGRIDVQIGYQSFHLNTE